MGNKPRRDPDSDETDRGPALRDSLTLRSTPEGDQLVAAHLFDYRKTRNIRRDARVAVTIVAPKVPGAPTPYLSITGTAHVVECGATELSVAMAEAMLGSSETFPPPDAAPGFVTHIRIDHRVGGKSPIVPVGWVPPARG